ncbi:tRNA (guanosine(37)-N1)-methyltransferase TrmD [Collinsella sp. AGMB00827]|uniref:tRNA (guanine-N(1)-)-methyltransferase n=1 Tax=Collinsella ureilytica TaxID=2869515 RepID=A0ABS7ML97_9ACTN|nr:tRNA (guanosine(37)-N1)-methyltransferase TrmD [Collinsella urealyticum]MBY4798052.1 tRNA (guanosine(37)-N1)-methyltransferase TrmD [Collinsella urealyticum]
MIIEALSVFPDVFDAYMHASILGRAQREEIFEFHSYDLRDWTYDRHRSVDDEPYGGGAGMLMKVEPIVHAVESIQQARSMPARTIFFTPAGTPFSQREAERLAGYERLLFVCGRYEGIDERAFELVADECISLGDYVLTGGELAAMVVSDAVVRLLPGALGDAQSSLDESFSASLSHGLLEYAQYTRPASFRGHEVPEVLRSGDHARIKRWRRENSLERTLRFRPDLLECAHLSHEELAFLETYCNREKS